MLLNGIIERVYKAVTKQFGDYKSIQESDLKKTSLPLLSANTLAQICVQFQRIYRVNYRNPQNTEIT